MDIPPLLLNLSYTEPKIAPNSALQMVQTVLHTDEVTTSFKCGGLSGGDDEEAAI